MTSSTAVLAVLKSRAKAPVEVQAFLPVLNTQRAGMPVTTTDQNEAQVCHALSAILYLFTTTG